MSDDLVSRARGCLSGLAVGDALGSPTEGKTPEVIARRWGRVTDFLTDEQTGSDDTEYALFNARLLLKHGPQLTASIISSEWKSEIITTANSYKGAGFSEMLAIRNLKSGLMPPQSGQHLHSWSDGLAMRVAPFGIVAAGRPDVAARLAGMDGSVTHAGEGIYAGQAVAAAVATAVRTNSVEEIVTSAVGAIPSDSWTRRAIDRAVAIGRESTDCQSALGPLHRSLVTPQYFWPDLAPEAVALAFGIIVAARGDFLESVLGGVNIGRDTDTIAAIAGAITGGLHGVEFIPSKWKARVATAQGTCLLCVRGLALEEAADDLVAVAGRWS